MNVIKNDLRAKTLGVLEKTLHELGAHHAIGIRRPIVDLGGRHQLPALRQAGDEDRPEVRAGCVDGSGIAGGAGAQNEHAAMLGLIRHARLVELPVQGS